METSTIEGRKLITPAEWEAARKELLIKEKALTRQRDEVDRQRRQLPWVKVEKEYLFDGPGGQETLADLFEGRSQLIVQHFMFGPGWSWPNNSTPRLPARRSPMNIRISKTTGCV